MKKAGGGSIVNMSSTAALIGLGPYLAYSAAKGGIRSMTKSIAIHCRMEGLGIRCNSVHPGSISTPMVHTALKTLMGTDLMAEEDPEAVQEPHIVAITSTCSKKNIIVTQSHQCVAKMSMCNRDSNV